MTSKTVFCWGGSLVVLRGSHSETSWKISLIINNLIKSFRSVNHHLVYNALPLQVLSSEGALIETLPVDSKPFYLFGRVAETSDITLVRHFQMGLSYCNASTCQQSCIGCRTIHTHFLDLQGDSSCSRTHAALVHHEDGRVYLIDLNSVSLLKLQYARRKANTV